MSSFGTTREKQGHRSTFLPRVMAVANGKGGVGKTTSVANIAGTLAKTLKVLVLDFDPQGDLHLDLGIPMDDGKDLLASLISGKPAKVIAGVRPNLDVIPGGMAMAGLPTILAASRDSDDAEDLGDLLYDLLDPIADDYDLILIDTPPGDLVIVEAALAVSRFVLIPSKSDEASIAGVERIGRRFAAVRERNPELELIGVLLFAVNPRSLRLERSVRSTLEGIIGGVAPVLKTRIRNLETASADSRSRGLLFFELEQAAKEEKAKRIAQLRAKSEGESISSEAFMFSSNPKDLAIEYEDVCRELLARIAEVEAADEQEGAENA